MNKVIAGFVLGAVLGVAVSLTVPAVGQQQGAETSQSKAEKIAKRALRYAKRADRRSKKALHRTTWAYDFRVVETIGVNTHGAAGGAVAGCNPGEVATGGGGEGDKLVVSRPITGT